MRKRLLARPAREGYILGRVNLFFRGRRVFSFFEKRKTEKSLLEEALTAADGRQKWLSWMDELHIAQIPLLEDGNLERHRLPLRSTASYPEPVN